MRRLVDVAKEWGRLLAIGNKWQHRVTVLLVWVGAFIGLRSLLDGSVDIVVGLHGKPALVSWSVNLSSAVFSTVAVLYGALIWGIAWERCPVSVLRMGDLRPNPTQQYFRLPVYIEGGGKVSPEVTMMDIFDSNGQSLNDAGPFELHWSHHPQETRGVLSPGDDKTVGVVSVERDSVGNNWTRFEGMIYPCTVQTRWTDGKTRKVFFRIRAGIPGSRKWLEAVFSLEPEERPPLYHRATTEEQPRWVRSRARA